jgi:hypothetical protein
MRGLLGLLTATALWLGASSVLAHSSSTSIIEVAREEANAFSLRLDLPLRDLALVFPLDRNQDGQVIWAEVLTNRDQIEPWIREGLRLRNDQGPCVLGPMDWAIARYEDDLSLSLMSRFLCEAPRQEDSTALDYRLLFEQDVLHRALLKVKWGDEQISGVLSPSRSELWLSAARQGFWGVLWGYLIEGVWHIWIGADHIVFLLSLLLPSVLRRRGARFGQWESQPHFWATLRQVLAVVTAFTVAHSVTLGLAALGLVSLPGALVEVAIAASVVVAALGNLASRTLNFRWQMAFGFGLIHGFGFASVLGDLGLPAQQLAGGLLGFNLGVELGQLAIVMIFIPLAWWLRNTAIYRWGFMVAGSGGIALAGLYWMFERIVV